MSVNNKNKEKKKGREIREDFSRIGKNNKAPKTKPPKNTSRGE